MLRMTQKAARCKGRYFSDILGPLSSHSDAVDRNPKHIVPAASVLDLIAAAWVRRVAASATRALICFQDGLGRMGNHVYEDILSGFLTHLHRIACKERKGLAKGRGQIELPTSPNVPPFKAP